MTIKELMAVNPWLAIGCTVFVQDDSGEWSDYDYNPTMHDNLTVLNYCETDYGSVINATR